MRIRNVKANAAMCPFISLGLAGELAIRAMEPIESESPNIRSASVSILGRGWGPPGGCNCRRWGEFGIWSFLKLCGYFFAEDFVDSWPKLLLDQEE